MTIVEVSIKAQTQGYANITDDGELITIWLQPIHKLMIRLFKDGIVDQSGRRRETFQLPPWTDDDWRFSWEVCIETLVIHELIHKFQRNIQEYQVDAWNRLICFADSGRESCLDCPFECQNRYEEK